MVFGASPSPGPSSRRTVAGAVKAGRPTAGQGGRVLGLDPRGRQVRLGPHGDGWRTSHRRGPMVFGEALSAVADQAGRGLDPLFPSESENSSASLSLAMPDPAKSLGKAVRLRALKRLRPTGSVIPVETLTAINASGSRVGYDSLNLPCDAPDRDQEASVWNFGPIHEEDAGPLTL